MARIKKHRSSPGIIHTGHLCETSEHHKGRVLLVDDDEFLVQIGQEMLGCLGYEIAVETSGLKALTTFRTAPQQFTLVIVDYDMPHMTGDVLARELRRIRPNIPLILCTGRHIGGAEQAHLLGFDTLLRKPFRLHELALAIDLALLRRASSQS